MDIVIAVVSAWSVPIEQGLYALIVERSKPGIRLVSFDVVFSIPVVGNEIFDPPEYSIDDAHDGCNDEGKDKEFSYEEE